MYVLRTTSLISCLFFLQLDYISNHIDPGKRRPSISSTQTQYSPLERKEFEPLNPPQQMLDNEKIPVGGRDTASESLSSDDYECEDSASKTTSSLDADCMGKADDEIMEQSLEGGKGEPNPGEKEEEKEIHLGDMEKGHHVVSDIPVEDTNEAVSHLPQNAPDGYVPSETPFGVDWNVSDDPFYNSRTFPTHDRQQHVVPTHDFDDYATLLYLVSSRDSSASGYIFANEGITSASPMEALAHSE